MKQVLKNMKFTPWSTPPRLCVVIASVMACASAQANINMSSKSNVQDGHLIVEPQVRTQCHWDEWTDFKAHYIRNGRVIDNSDPRSITTSEGQSYGLFFALVANDQTTFDNLLDWTQQNLTEGDLSSDLPAWLWGTKEDQTKGILDSNTASDSDLWIAYTLIEAGRLWDNHYYQSLGHLLAARILREETGQVDHLGKVVLPGKTGFELEDSVRLNPSYYPMQVMSRLGYLMPKSPWESVEASSEKVILESMPLGFSPDWVLYQDKAFVSDSDTQDIGSYNSIRTYLWAGMLDDNAPQKAQFIEKMQPLVDIIDETGEVPETLYTRSGQWERHGNIGFKASVIPLLVASGKNELAQDFAHQVEAELPNIRKNNYYSQVLSLFGLGWYNKVYRFDNTGQLIPNWTVSCD